MTRYVTIDVNGAEKDKQELFNNGKNVKSNLKRFPIKLDDYGRECIYVDGLKYYIECIPEEVGTVIMIDPEENAHSPAGDRDNR